MTASRTHNRLIVMENDPTASASVAERFRTALDRFEAGVDLMRQNLRRRHPGADEHESERLLQQWLLERPGAEAGDCPGRAIDVKSRFK